MAGHCRFGKARLVSDIEIMCNYNTISTKSIRMKKGLDSGMGNEEKEQNEQKTGGTKPHHTKEHKKKRTILVRVIVVLLALVAGFAAGRLLGSENKAGRDSEEKKPSGNVTLGEYKGVEVDLSVSDQDVQNAIEELLEDKATYEEKEGTANEGDTVNIDYVASIDGEEIEDGAGENVTIGEGIELYEEELVGMHTGESKEVSIIFPQDEEDEYAGQAAIYTITLNYIQGKQILPVLDEDFVAQNTQTGSKTVEEFKEEKRKELYQTNVDFIGDSAWEIILENCEVHSYPEDIKKAVRDDILSGYQDIADMSGITLEETIESMGYDSMQTFEEEELEAWVQETAMSYLVADAIAKAEDIELSDEEYEDALQKKYSGYYAGIYGSIDEYEKENGEILRWDTLLQKVKDWVGDQAVIQNT